MTVEQLQYEACPKIRDRRVPGLVDASDAAPSRDGVRGRVREVVVEFLSSGRSIFGIDVGERHSEKLECVLC